MSNYHPEKYWSEVADRILEREGGNVVAGDDEPYYRYKRARFLEMLQSLDFQGKSVMELGSGPGGNLNFISQFKPKRLTGADISQNMIELATKNTAGRAELVKIDGQRLPFDDQTFDLVFSATVLQHNSDDAMMKSILREMCRVSGDRVAIFERIEKTLLGDDLCMGRPVDYYAAICEAEGFELVETEFININLSYYVCGAIRKGLNPGTRKEGEPLNGISNFLQNATLTVTKPLDKVLTAKRDLGKLVFRRRG